MARCAKHLVVTLMTDRSCMGVISCDKARQRETRLRIAVRAVSDVTRRCVSRCRVDGCEVTSQVTRNGMHRMVQSTKQRGYAYIASQSLGIVIHQRYARHQEIHHHHHLYLLPRQLGDRPTQEQW